MDTEKRFFTGLDLGTSNFRVAIVAANPSSTPDNNSQDAPNGETTSLSVVGYNASPAAGMRKGVPIDLNTPAELIDRFLGEAERMAGYDVTSAYVSVNGSSVTSTVTEGLISLSSPDHEVTPDDLARLEDITIDSCNLKNREILDVVPLEYALDGQAGITDPLSMAGSRLEMRLGITSALTQVCENLRKTTSAADVQARRLVPNAVAAARAVLTSEQKENGVAVVDFGSATTSVAIYEEGDLQYTGVVPAGSHNVTNDLAIVLAISPALAEEIKTRHLSCDFEAEHDPVIHVHPRTKEERFFERAEIEKVAEARLTEIFTDIRKKIRSAGFDQRLPEGIILTGGGARMRDISVFARQVLEAAVTIGTPINLGGVADEVKKPEFAVSVGLALLAADDSLSTPLRPQNAKKASKKPQNGHFLSKIFSKF